MKRKYRLLSVILLPLLCGGAACAQSKEAAGQKQQFSNTAQPAESQDVIKEIVDGKEMSLKNDAGKCQFVIGETTVNLDIPWRCDFHRLADNAVRVFPRDFNVGKNKKSNKYDNTQIIIIEHSIPDPAFPKDCRTRLQALKIVDKKVFTSKATGNLASCPPFQWDEKNFIAPFQ